MAYVLDTSALVSYFKDEPEAGQVEVVLRQPDELMIPFMTLMELRYVLLRTFSASRVDQILETLRSCGASIVESSPVWGIQAAEIKDGKLGALLKNPTYTGITPKFWGSCDAVGNRDHWVVWGTPNCGKGQPEQVAHTGHGAAPARFRDVQVGIMQ